MGKKKSKSTTTNTPWQPAQPYLLGAASTIQNTVNAHQPQLDALTNDLTGRLPGLYNAALDTSITQPAFNYANDVLGGKYLNANPYTTGLAQLAGNDAANHVNSTFSLAGRTGSNDHATELAKGVDQAENGVLFQNYQNERAQQLAAAGLLPQINASRFAGLTPALAATQLAGQLPFSGTDSLARMGGLFSGYGTSTATQPNNLLGGLLGAGATLGSALIMKSDRRLKTNIRKLGEAKDGLGIYEWNWKTDPNGERVRGVIADEVEKLRPWAFVPNFKGQYAGVNYAALGSLA